MAGGRLWTQEEFEIVRLRYREDGARAVASSLGRSRRAVHHAAALLGLTKAHVRLTPREISQIASLAARGLTDKDIAARLGRSSAAVQVYRRRAGVPNAYSPEVHRSTCSEAAKVRIARDPETSPARLRIKAFQRFVADSGWPPEVQSSGARVLNVLAGLGAPVTTPDLQAALGFPRSPSLSKVFQPLAKVMRLGLVCRIPGRPPSYTLSLKALALLEEKVLCERTAGGR